MEIQKINEELLRLRKGVYDLLVEVDRITVLCARMIPPPLNAEKAPEAISSQKYYTIRQFCERHPFLTEGGMRHQLFNELGNGLKDSEAIVRMGRKILIDEEKYFKWVNDPNKPDGNAYIYMKNNRKV